MGNGKRQSSDHQSRVGGSQADTGSFRVHARLRSAVLLAICFSLRAAGADAPPPSQPALIHADGAAALAAADFNNDGALDLAVASPIDGTVAVYLRGSDGSYPAQATRVVSTGVSALKPGVMRHRAVAVGDLNADGNVDLLVADSTASSISVFLGRGDGSFRDPLTRDTLPLPSGMGLGDFNGDGRLDVAVVSQGTNKVAILVGTGDGRFASGTDVAVGLQPTSVVVGDFGTSKSVPARDGKLDLAVTATGDGQINLLFGDGNGAFSAPVKFDAPGATSITAADFNGDGVLDLATCNTAGNFVGMTLGYDKGAFGCFGNQTEEVNFGEAVRPTGLVAADFDGDGHLDLAVTGESADPSSSGVFLLFSRPRRRMRLVYFDRPAFCPTGGAPAAIVAEDPHGTGGLDLVVADKLSGRVWVLAADGKGGIRNCASPLQLGQSRAAGGEGQPVMAWSRIEPAG